MRRPWLLAPVLLLTLAGGATLSIAAKNSYNFFIGRKSISELEDLQLDRQPDLGAEISLARDGWPIAVALDLMASTTSEDRDVFAFGVAYDLDIKSTNFELDLGIRKIWEPDSPIRPYLGGGLAFGHGRLEVDLNGTSAAEEDTGVGRWVGGGVYWKIQERFNLGLNIRWSAIPIRFDGETEDLDIGGTHVVLILGWGP
jgi:hypothetical protein